MNQLNAFTWVILFITGGLIMAMAGMLVSYLIRPNRPNPEKLSSYECGEDPAGGGWIQINMRFYVMALIFLIFDVEVVFLFPWATVFAHPDLLAADKAWAWFSFIEILIFTVILVFGLAWLWKNGDLDWIKPEPLIPQEDSPVPLSAYQKINEKYQRFVPRVVSISPTQVQE